MNELKILAIRHGEVLLHPVDALPKGKKTQVKQFIVGHSETGHHHVLVSEEPFTVQEKEMYLQLLKPAKLIHQKSVNAHKTLTVPAGTYQVIHKTEYNPWTKLKQRVFD